jgi:signal transduction histidine kinase
MVESRLQPQLGNRTPAGSVELLGRAIHRVRNLLMSVRGFAELIAISSVGDPEHRRWAGRIVEQVDRLESLQSRVDGALRVAAEPGYHSMAMIARAAVERSRSRIQGPAAEIPVEVRVVEDLVVRVDGEDLAEAVAAVIDNAREATANSGSTDPVEVQLSSDTDQEWALHIRDRGQGLAPEDQSRLGEAFFTRKAGHLGLGIFLSQALLDRHGMQLDIEASGRGGTVARIRERRMPAGGNR